jgi:hypothetical protein
MSKRNILLWGALPYLPSGEDFKTAYNRSGFNLGNTLIGNGIVSVLNNYNYFYRGQLKSPQEANEICTHIVIPASNFLWKKFDLGFMADFLELTDLPITMIGLGAQTNDRSLITEIHPNTLRLVKIVSERSPSIGVRGFYTAEVLAAHGILNVEVLGCPSLYTYGAPPTAIANPKNLHVENLVVNFSRKVQGHSFNPEILKLIDNSLIEIAIKHNISFIAQDEVEEVALAHGNASENEISIISAHFSNMEKVDVINYFSKYTYYFYNVDSWSNFMKTRSGCIGSRLHGNIAALINGIPSMIIAHDSRTLELCALTGAPYLNVSDMCSHQVSPEFIIDKFQSSDYGLFLSNMTHLFVKYKNFLNHHNLTNRL